MDFTEKTISTRDIYKGRIIHVKEDTVLLPNGETAGRELVMHNGGVGVVALDDDKNVFLVRQYRKPYDESVLEIPAGKLEKGEEHSECGKRELLEETGYTCKSYKYLGKILPTPAYVTEVIHLYMASELEYSKQNLDKDEFLDVEKIPLKTAVEMVLNGEIDDAKTQIGILKAWHILKKPAV